MKQMVVQKLDQLEPNMVNNFENLNQIRSLHITYISEDIIT